MKSRLKVTIFLIIFSLFTALPTLSHAQTPTSLDLVNISIFPELPPPGRKVTVTIESFSTDLNAASIVWTVDGKNFAQGNGKKSIDLVAPPLGKKVIVIAIIKTVEGREVRKALTLKSGGVDLIWESTGFVHPMYEGRSRFAYENAVKIVAQPHLSDGNGSEIDPKTLVYKWTENENVIQDQSGYGRQSIVIQEETPRPIVVKVEVGTRDGTEKAVANITLTPEEPSLSFYQDDPLYGIFYNKSLRNDVTLTNSEINIRAVPYSFSFTKTTPLSYLWSINDVERTDLASKESIILRTAGDKEGTSRISLSVRSDYNIIQGAENGINILFKKKPLENNFTF